MIKYSLQGAWGNVIPDKKLLKALSDFGIELNVERRKDNLSNIKLSIDDDKILKKDLGKKTSSSTKKTTSKVKETGVTKKKEDSKKINKTVSKKSTSKK